MSQDTTVEELNRLVNETTFAALAEPGEIRQLEANGGRLEITEYRPLTVMIHGLHDGHMTYLVQSHDWMISTSDEPHVWKRMNDF